MTRLLIDGQEVVLPNEFTATITEENPFFTKNGQYTYDLTLSLLNPVNARIYKHFDRSNNDFDLVSKRSAVLICDDRVRLNGTEVLVSFPEDSVSIQLVSGNSELNYLIGGDLKVRSLDLGAAVIVPSEILTDSQHSYPDRNWLLLPFANNDNDTIGNDYYYPELGYRTLNGETQEVTIQLNLKYAYDGVHVFKNAANQNIKYQNYRPQPYFGFIINQIFSSLGYTLLTNMVSSHSVFKNYYVVHGYNTLKFAEMLPDWTVKSFFEEIEKLFDCTVIINENKTVEILFNYHYLTTNAQKELKVIDKYSSEIESENKLSHKDVNIGYSLDSDEYYQLNKIDSSIKEAATYVDISLVSPEMDLLAKVTNTNDAYRFNKIFKTAPAVNQKPFEISRYIAFNNGSTSIPKKIDAFCDLKNNIDNNDNLDIELNIIPAAMKWVEKVFHPSDYQGYASTVKYYVQFPVAEYADPFFTEGENGENEFTIQGLVTGSDSIPKTTLTSKLRLAIYDGRKDLSIHGCSEAGGGTPPTYLFWSTTYGFPKPWVESLSESFQDIFSFYYLAGTSNPFRLAWMHENIYSLTSKINTTRAFKFVFPDPGKVDIKSRFLINNREYLCAKMERGVSINGMDKLVTGYFYAIG